MFYTFYIFKATSSASSNLGVVFLLLLKDHFQMGSFKIMQKGDFIVKGVLSDF